MDFMFLQATGLGLQSVCEFALMIGADPNTYGWTGHGSSVVHHAIMEDDVAALRSLLRGGADLHCEDEKGVSPLLLAVTMERFAIVDLLVQYGASLDTLGCKELEMAALSHVSLWPLQLLFEKLGTMELRGELLHQAVRQGYVDLVRLLIQPGADLEIRNMWGETGSPCCHEQGSRSYDGALNLMRGRFGGLQQARLYAATSGCL